MEALALRTVHLLEFSALARLQVHQPQIGIVLADGEIPTTAHTVHQPTAVVTGTCQHIALIRRRTIQQGIHRLAKCAFLCIEGDSAKRTLHFLIFCWHTTRLRRAVIDVFTVCREGREDLQIVRKQQWREDQFVATGIEHLHIAEPMVHLNTLASTREETLMHGVHGHGHIVALGMPVAIRTCRSGDVGLRLYPRLMTVFLNHRTATLTTHLQSDTIGIRAVGRMAVETTAWHHGLRQDSVFIKGMDIPLVDADIASHLIARLDTAIGQSPVVEALAADENRKVLVLCPLAVFLHADRHRQLSALVLFCQLVPVVDVEVGKVTLSMYLSAFTALDDHIHTVDRLIGKVKVQWCNIGRDCHPDIVRIDFRQRVRLHDILW